MSKRRAGNKVAKSIETPNPASPLSFDLDKVIKDIAMAQALVPEIMKQTVQKGWKQLPNTDPAKSPRSWFHDPLSLQYSLGYKDRKFSLTYDTLKRMASQLALVGAIINTRSAQVAAFSQPYRWTKSLGFVIRHKDPDHPTTPAEQAFIKELEQFILNCGRSEKNPYSRVKRDDFESFLRKLVRDSLTYDQTAVEVVPDGLGIPFEFYAVDATTIRIAADDRYGVNTSYHSRSGFVPSMPARFHNLYEGAEYGKPRMGANSVDYVQVINGQIENVYGDIDALKCGQSALAFGVRNPRTDIWINGYGLSELEQLITIVTSHLFAETYNRNFFSQGTNAKGLLNLKGDNYTPEMLEGFRRQWLSQAAGVENSWRTPVFQSEGIEWIDLNKSNQEMEFGKWLEYLTKLSCAVFLIDPSEVNFEVHAGMSQTPMFESSQEWKIKASRDRGLKPLLRFLAKLINKNIIDAIDDHFTFEFVGLDELSETEKHEMLVEQISSYMTLNEARRQLDLPDLPHGDVPLNAIYAQNLERAQLAEQTAQITQQSTTNQNTPSFSDANKSPAAPQYTQHAGFNQGSDI